MLTTCGYDDPDGAGALKPLAVRTTYRSDGQVSKVERGTVNSQSDADWPTFAPLDEVQTGFDANDRPSSQKLVAGGTIYALTQTSYDALGRPECVAQRMNPAIFATIATGACSLGTQGSGAGDYGPDRIAKPIYDAAGQVTQVKTAVGTTLEAAEATNTYTANGLVATVKDGENNLTTYEHDGHDRLAKTRFPSSTKGAGTSSTTDYEQLTYESLAGGTRTSNLVTAFRNRANQAIAFGYDALGRLTLKDVPEAGGDVAYAYDLLGSQLSALYSATGLGISGSYDALRRQTATTTNLDGTARTYSFQYDLAGRRTRVTHPDGPYFDYAYDGLGRMTTIKDNAAATLVTLAYDSAGRRDTATYANGVVTGYDFDAVGRLTVLAHDFAGTAQDVTFGYAWNPASQIVSRTASNDLYSYPQANSNVAYTANGLNQFTSVGGGAATYDLKGNLLTEGGRTMAYDSENKLTSASTPQVYSVVYDPLGRFRGIIQGTATAGLDFVGGDLLAMRVNGGATTERYAFGRGVDEPMVGYDSAGTRLFFHADERGSIVARSDSTGSAAGRTYAYDEYGKASVYSSRFLYAGKMHLGGVNAYYNNTRFYDYTLGRFLQPDPIGYAAGMNLYAYVKGDPVNFTDPLGLCTGSRTGSCGFLPSSCQGNCPSEESSDKPKPTNTITSKPDSIVPDWIRRCAAGDCLQDPAVHSMDTETPMIGSDPIGLEGIFVTMSESLARLLDPAYIGNVPREVNVRDLGTTEGGVITIWGTIHHSRDSLNIHIYNIESIGFRPEGGLITQGLETAVNSARTLRLRRIVITGLLANVKLKAFIESGRFYPGATLATMGGVDFLEIPVR